MGTKLNRTDAGVIHQTHNLSAAKPVLCVTQLLLSPPAGCLLAVEIERGFDVPTLLQLSK